MNITFLDYLHKPSLIDDANEIAKRVEAGEFEAAMSRLLILHRRCQTAGLSALADSAWRAIEALEPREGRGALGAELFTLTGEIENALAVRKGALRAYPVSLPGQE